MIINQLNRYLPPKVYHAKIVDGSFTPVVLLNTTGVTVSCSNQSGHYKFTFSSAILNDKTSVVVSTNAPDLGQGATWTINGWKQSTTEIVVKPYDTTSGGADGVGFEVIVTIF